MLLCSASAQIALPTFQAAHTPHSSSSGSQTLSYTGSAQTFTVPSGVSTITIKVWGAQGGSGGYWSSGSYCGTGGKGGYSTGELSVTPGNTVYVYVGGQGESYASCQTRMSGTSHAGGWNGGGTGQNSTRLSNGGAGGGASGQTMANSTQFYSRTPGTGATQSSGNSNGIGSTANQNLSGGGGGGYFGGGTGQNSTGGGGGSGYIGGVSSAETIAGNATMTDPDGGTMTGREGNGLVVITW